MLKIRYPGTDIIIFADLNIDFELTSGKKFFEKLDNRWTPIFPPAPTRIGVGQ
jgi:hypothetical protein